MATTTLAVLVTAPAIEAQSGGRVDTATDDALADLETIVPARLLDTRAGVPDDAEAAVLNVTVARTSGDGFVTAYPCGAERPQASTLNFRRGVNIANGAVIEVGTAGTVCIYSSVATHLVVDVTGSTILVGAETGGAPLVEAGTAATDASELDDVLLSLNFGQGRSDHAVFESSGVPIAFYTDSTNGCYHTVFDDIEHLDTDKLVRQIDAAHVLVDDLVTNDEPPTYVASDPVSTYADAVGLLDIVRRGEPDLALLPDEDEAAARSFLDDLQVIVDAGQDAYDCDAVGTVLGGASLLASALASSECLAPA